MLDDKNFCCQYITPFDIGKTDPGRPGNNKPLANAPSGEPYSGNIYYYWYHFHILYVRHRSAAKAAPSPNAAEILIDFDIVSGEGFEDWWKRKGRWLFSDMFETEAQPTTNLNREQIADLKDGMAFFFPFDGNLPYMLKQAEEAFKIARLTYYDRRPDMRRKYELATRRYDLEGLYNKLVVYDAVMKAPLTDSFGKIFSAIHDDLILPRSLKYLTPDDISDFMSGHFDGACRLIYHLARGKFPVYAKPQGKYNPRK
ncbi:hypothetical protein ACUJ46_03610 [Sandaracinobacteroides sp. A072]|uniref:hypothetical protein n=1 Tax=Sandaracinobacteroides sp. A072 TaxID=3461146 RepID=UPI004043809F